MLSYYFQGLVLGTVMIPPLDPQSVFVTNRGIRRQYHTMIALSCAISDLVLVCAGISGGGAPLMQPSWLLALATWDGVASLLWYGFGALKTAMSSNIESANAEVLKQGRWGIIATTLAAIWLNSHAHLDTFVVLGSLDRQLDVEPKRWFALGTISASFLWFFGLTIFVAWLVLRLRTAKSQRITSLVVGCVMWFIALQLARDGTAHAQALFSYALPDEKIKQRR